MSHTEQHAEIARICHEYLEGKLGKSEFISRLEYIIKRDHTAARYIAELIYHNS